MGNNKNSIPKHVYKCPIRVFLSKYELIRVVAARNSTGRAPLHRVYT